MNITWNDLDHPRYTADYTIVNGQLVVVCLDDEGPMRPAFYWTIEEQDADEDGVHAVLLYDGWASSVELAKQDALIQAGAYDLQETS